MKNKLIKPALILCCGLLFACKNGKVKEIVRVKEKKKPAICCSSNLPSRFGFKKLTSNVRPFGEKQAKKSL
ncbi:hypothetical protein QF042_002274 [Pedobacter sp. W3I1]|uniref:hypothetical protein n=1 Tax=Pedobacter sp. W3I1 TaxID=3042291 RepID=UPI002787CD2C|nr:hypothetical protein [Pedobacter sp. W3I1]MDQ0638709.1 hypothetical protein [Pedobacter sp. W3I1]